MELPPGSMASQYQVGNAWVQGSRAVSFAIMDSCSSLHQIGNMVRPLQCN